MFRKILVAMRLWYQPLHASCVLGDDAPEEIMTVNDSAAIVVRLPLDEQVDVTVLHPVLQTILWSLASNVEAVSPAKGAGGGEEDWGATNDVELEVTK
jgi:hypothetical protein